MILYAVVARAKDGIILVESIVAGVEGNFPQITVEVLDHVVKKSINNNNNNNDEDNELLLPEGGKRTFKQTNEVTGSIFGGLFSSSSSSSSGVATQWNNCWMNTTNTNTCNSNDVNDVESPSGDLDYYFHLYRKDNIICLCISDDTVIRYHAVNYDFLIDVGTKFTNSYASYIITKAKAYEMEKKFNIELTKILYYYNTNRNNMIKNDKIHHLLGKVDNLKLLLGHNITMVLDRDEQLHDMVVQSEHMMNDSKVFTKRSSTLKKKMRLEYYSSQIIIAIVFGILVVYLFFAHICGYTGGKCAGGQE